MRIRVIFSKTGALRYIGHLDLQTMWERAARRAGLPLAYSQGFHPQPKIQLAAALPLGFSSRCEVVDMKLKTDVDLEALPARLQEALPPGLGILKVESVDERAAPLQTQVTAAEYEVILKEPIEGPELASRAAAILEVGSLPRERRGKSYDLRPLIEELKILPRPQPLSQPFDHAHLCPPVLADTVLRSVQGSPGRHWRTCACRLAPACRRCSRHACTCAAGASERCGTGAGRQGRRERGVILFMRLAARQGATGRPEEVLDALGVNVDAARIERTRLIFHD